MFDTLGEALGYIKKLRKGILKQCQNRKKYRAKKNRYRIPKKLGKGSIFISSRKLRKRIKNCEEKLEVQEIKATKRHVLQKLLKKTLKRTTLANWSP